MPLYDLIVDRYSDEGDIQRIVEQAGGTWNLVGGGGQTLRNRVHFALTYLARDTSLLTQAVAAVTRDGYMTDDVARSVAEFLAPSDAAWGSMLSKPQAGGGLSSSQERQGNPRQLAAENGLRKQQSTRESAELLSGMGGEPPQNSAGRAATGSAPRAARLDQVRVVEQRLAVEALERLGGLMNEALLSFARQDACGAEPGVPTGEPLGEYLEKVTDLQSMIESGGDADEPDLATVFECLNVLIATVLDGIRVAETELDYTAAAGLAEDAARACEAVASLAGEVTTADLLRRVVPYWKMKGEYSTHQGVVQHRKQLMAKQSAADEAPRLSQIRSTVDSIKTGANN
jgi:hypothetical protein